MPLIVGKFTKGDKTGQYVPKVWTNYPPNLLGLRDSMVNLKF
jgi:hypothetical protein